MSKCKACNLPLDTHTITQLRQCNQLLMARLNITRPHTNLEVERENLTAILSKD